jgi:hypothetical protein
VRPIILKVDDQVAVQDPASGEPRWLRRHERIGPWTLMATLELGPGRAVAVFEDLQHND